MSTARSENTPHAVTLMDVPDDLISELLEALGPAAIRYAAVSRLLGAAVSDKLRQWRARRVLAASVDFTSLPPPQTVSARWPLHRLRSAYDAVGVRFSGSALAVESGVSAGDPGNWQLEGTGGRGLPGGGRFIGLNSDGQTLHVALRSPASGISFDVVTRDAEVEVSVCATACGGAPLLEHRLKIGPRASSWLSPGAFGHDAAFDAAAIATTHCTSVCLVREAAERGLRVCRPSESLAAMSLALRPDDEICSVTLTLHDRGRKDDGCALGVANVRVHV
jgi:hypothetical protein